MTIEFDREQAIADYIVDNVTLILDNEETSCNTLSEVSRQYVLDDLGYDDGTSPDNYRDELNREPVVVYEGVGNAVADCILDFIEACESNLVSTLLLDLLDIHSSVVKYKLGKHYAPTYEDYEEWYDVNVLGIED